MLPTFGHWPSCAVSPLLLAVRNKSLKLAPLVLIHHRMITLLRDLRFSLRMAYKNRGFTLIAILTLALGIGANTAVFSMVRAALLTPLPIPDPDRVVMVWTANLGRDLHQLPASGPDYLDWQNSGIFERLGALEEGGFNLRTANRTERLKGLFVTPETFQALGLTTTMGRLFSVEDAQPGHEPVAVLTNALWRSSFASDPAIIGRSIVLNGAHYTVIGVLPARYRSFAQEQIYALLDMRTPQALDRGARSFGVLGRLRSGLTLESAQKRMDDISRQLSRQFPESDAGDSVVLQPLEEATVQDVRALVLVLFGAVGFVLLIACANIANLLLARGAERAKELAVRAALGAGRRALVSQLLTESVVLALLGGVLGLIPALWGTDFIASFQLPDMPDAGQMHLNAGVLAFTFALSIGTGVFFGLAPAWQVWKTDVNETLKTSGRTNTGSVSQRLRGVFVAGEIALTLVLLVGAGLMVRSFWQFQTTPPGYTAHGVLTARVVLSDRQYDTPSKQVAYFEEAVRRIRQAPGVLAVSAAHELPTSDELHGRGLRFSGRPEPKPDDIPIVLVNSVMPGYFRAMQVPILHGRDFNDSDRSGRPSVALVDQWTAAKYWPHADPVGQFIKFGRKDEPELQIVGVVGDVEESMLVKLLKGRLGAVYLPFAQTPEAAMSLTVRNAGESINLAPSLQRVVRQLDADQPLFDVRSLESARGLSAAPQRLAAVLLGGFAAMALLLAAIGVYGVVSYSVTQRTREIGVRMALGAARSDVLQLIVRQGLLLTLVGLTAGLAGALALVQALKSLVFGVGLADPVTFVLVCLTLGGTALLATYIPARRATRLEPIFALRNE